LCGWHVSERDEVNPYGLLAVCLAPERRGKSDVLSS
jgi:hypothetical protein